MPNSTWLESKLKHGSDYYNPTRLLAASPTHSGMVQMTQTPGAAHVRARSIITMALGAACLLTGCSFGTPEQVEVTTRVTTTETKTATTTRVDRVTETETTTVTPAAPPAAATPIQPPVEVPAPGAAGPDAPRGYTGAPGTEPIRELDKQIAGCGGVEHERGTTFFTDGTSGWTEQCAAVMG